LPSYFNVGRFARGSFQFAAAALDQFRFLSQED
jgi:hypothetical protein